MLVDNTPLEVHNLNGVPILVKREDLSCPLPGPSFSKLRGVVAHIRNRPEHVIGVLDTYHSKAGWAVSYVCHHLGKQAVDFWPRYKKDGDAWLPRPQQQRAYDFHAHMVALQAGRSAILYHEAKKRLAASYPAQSTYMMPNALKLPESVSENAAEAERSAANLPPEAVLVISISSGTVAAGVLLGLSRAGLLDRYTVILHMGYSRSQDAALAYMEKVSGLSLGGRVQFVDEGYGYADAAKGVDVPFPCNPHYDAKAWKWLSKPEVLAGLVGTYGKPIVFWNIGE